MNPLLEKYNDYIRLKNCTVEYGLNNGDSIVYTYDENAFLHLTGLHKLLDLQLIQLWQAKNVRSVNVNTIIRKIKQEKFTDADVRASVHFGTIEDRYNNFNYENLTTLNYTDAIVDFNARVMNSKLKGDYILFEEKGVNQYNHMSIAFDPSGYRYIETFFHEPSNRYLIGQNIVPIATFKLLDPQGNTIVEDNF